MSVSQSALLARISTVFAAGSAGYNLQDADYSANNALQNNFKRYTKDGKLAEEISYRKFNILDARSHYRKGDGGDIVVDASELDLDDAEIIDNGDGTIQIRTFNHSEFGVFESIFNRGINTPAIYGTITAVDNGDGTISILPDTHDFEPHVTENIDEKSREYETNRNIITTIGRIIHQLLPYPTLEPQNPFRIKFEGTVEDPRKTKNK